jgi:PEP-CTERM motif
MNHRLTQRLAQLTTAAALTLTMAAAQAAQIFAVDISPGPNQLVTIDSAAPGTATVIGQMGVQGLVSGLDFDRSGRLFATTQAATNFFYAVNPATGAATLIGGSGLRDTHALQDLAWDPHGQRMLGLASINGAGASLYDINTATGEATLLTNLGALANDLAVGLAADSDGTLFIHGLNADAWYKVTPDLASVTMMGPLGTLTNFQQGGTLDWSGDGTLYHGLLSVSSSPSRRSLYTVDKITGAGTDLGLLGENLFSGRGVEVGDLAVRPNVVPEPGSLALIAGALGLLGWQRRRKV